MAYRLERPTNPYDPAWVEYRKQNPGLRLSLSAADDEDNSTPDLSFLPDEFKDENGGFNVDGFKDHYSELVAFKGTVDDAKAQLPQEPSGYEFAIPEGHVLPEGFDPKLLERPMLDDDGKPVLDENGQPKIQEFDVNQLINADDPDLPLLQAALHKYGADPALTGELASILANRELNAVMKAAQAAADETKALGPESQSRIDVVTRTIKALVPASQANAILDGITSADALRGIEGLLKTSKNPPPDAKNTQIDNATASIDDRIMAGLRQRQA